MHGPIRDVLLIAGVDWRHDPRAARHTDRAPRLAAVLIWLLDRISAAGDGATVGLFGETIRAQPALAEQVIRCGCELAAMTFDCPDPWSLSPGLLRDQVEQTIAAAKTHGLPEPTSFLPPFPRNQRLQPAQAAALREAGIKLTLGCRGEDLSALELATIQGHPLAGGLARALPNWVLRGALRRAPNPAALCLSCLDVDPGSPVGGFGRRSLLQRLPRLLAGGFIAAAEAYGK